MNAKLPNRTQIYLANGAIEGLRNSELLAAACQCRDAGMAAGEAQAILVSRAVADGLTKGEAISTVKSAFSRPPRDSIQTKTGNFGFKHFSQTTEQLAKIESQIKERRLAARSSSSRRQILEQFACEVADYSTRSPIHLPSNDRSCDWSLILKLFGPDDVIWIGTQKNESANKTHAPEWIDYCKTRFRKVSAWLEEPECPGILICPNTFKAGTHSRSDTEVLTRGFLVIESDTLTKNQMCAVFRWTEQFTRLRAIVDTAGKSLHGWFQMPSECELGQLEIILPQLGCDSSMFVPSQPCRLPGGFRAETGRIQTLLYLNLDK